MTITNTGKKRFAGKAARNCARGCARLAQAGRKPSQTPIGTQTKLASTMRTMTRNNVTRPSRTASPRSVQVNSAAANVKVRQLAHPNKPQIRMTHTMLIVRDWVSRRVHGLRPNERRSPPKDDAACPTASPTKLRKRVRRIRRRIQGSEAVAPAVVSKRNFADQ